jgi:hypothetical protein
MGKRWLVAGAGLAVMALAAAPVAAQAPATGARSAKASSRAWTPTKTPWGDPDIEGVWTSDSVRGIPTQRPAELAGKTELTDEEFAKKVARDEKTRKTAEDAEGAFRNDGAWLKKSFRQTSLVVEPADGRIPPLTPDAQKRAATRDRGSFGEGPFYSPEDFTLYDRCITRGIVGSVLPVVYGNGNRILQAPGEVVISYEMVHDTRVIPLDGRPHIGSKIRQYLGDSRGHWEGNSLVVETTNLTDQTSIGANGNGLRHSADMKIVERFTRTDADVLQYEIVVDDPKTYARPFKIAIPLISPPGFQLLPYECHEGNYMLANVLRGERAEDRALEEDAKRGIVRARKGVQQGLDAGARPTPALGRYLARRAEKADPHASCQLRRALVADSLRTRSDPREPAPRPGPGDRYV